ncbi:LacI family DNA-binding transcriptional regulator [Propioniciclava soli]|uniref:LacI family DNA-binding transcriptional regulator n=1 Tax=Propioniciclava soli TaxID=2775081 RepID=A0ABZ3C7Q4_9ACTN|nr:LacI family DNA-binding transcriptional regulator [Propioniciclava soli]
MARRITARDIADEVGVSRATVGFVLNRTPGQSISPDVQDRVRATAERLGYRPHRGAQTLARGASHVVLYRLPDWPMGHAMRLHLAEFTRLLGEAGYAVVTETITAAPAVRPLWEVVDPDAVVQPVPLSEEESRALATLTITRVVAPTAAVDEAAYGLVEGTRHQVRHLTGLGHRRLAFARPGDPRLAGLAGLRATAAQQEARDAGCGELVVVDTPASATEAVAALAEVTDAGATGVVAYDDDVAAALIGAAALAGVAVPAELSVVGHDNAPLCDLVVPALTSVWIDHRDLGRRTAEAVLSLLTDRDAPTREPIVTHLAERCSTAPMPPKPSSPPAPPRDAGA